MELNQQQIDVLNWVRKGTGSLNLIARAGCGKTTTLLSVVDTVAATFPGKNMFLGAFNKAIAVEIGAKLKAKGIDWKQAESGTMHSIGFRLWRKAAPGVKVEEKKVQYLIEDAAAVCGPLSVYARAGKTIDTAVSLAKQSGCGWMWEVKDHSAWFDLFDHHGINDLPEGTSIAEVIAACIYTITLSYEQDHEVIDFNDMVTAPIVHNLHVRYPYDYVLIDEAQDTNAARRSLALKLLRPKTGRMIAVGDDRQAIYGFTGADADAMELIRKELGSVVLPLNVTYRCPKAIVAAAQRIVPDITAHESAPEGSVGYMDLNDDIEFKKTDVVLCRNTAPLIEMAYALLGKKIPCRVEGRDIGKSLELLARRWQVKTLAALRNKLDDYVARETAKWSAKGREDKIAAVDDKVGSMFTLIDACTKEGKTTIDELCEVIRGMFGDTPIGITPDVLTLSTVHKAKGREWPRVFVLRSGEFMPSPWARKEWQVNQEMNLIYVAITRAQEELIYLG